MITDRLAIAALLCILAAPQLLFAQDKAKELNAMIMREPDAEDLVVFRQWVKWNNPGSMLLNLLNRDAVKLYDKRNLEVKGIVTEHEWKERQAYVKSRLNSLIGPFPQKTPLNPRITGTIRKDGYRIEKVIFESFPGFHVTGCLYVPDRIKGKMPAVLHVIGHNQESFRADLYQVISYNLMKKGMIVFAIDPPGQGEHVQHYSPEVKFSSVGYSVVEHNYFGNYSFLSGYSCAYYFIWDGIRAIDYLISRKDVDPERIGVTGFSGGGTVSAFIGAVDERIKVAVPCSWANTNKRLVETKAVQDAESNIYHSALHGISFADLIEVRAPKPTLLTFVSRDEYLCLQGAREAFEEARSAFSALGKSDNLVMVEDDSKHWLTPGIRLSIYSFFMKHFEIAGDPSEIEAEIMPAEQLNVTHTGQIASSVGGEMIFDVNKRIAEKQIASIATSREQSKDHLGTVKSAAMQLSGYEHFISTDNQMVINGRYQRNGYTIGKYAIETGDDYALPLLLFIPDDRRERHPAVIWLNPKGKAADAAAGGEIEKLVKKGYIVAALDPLGTGETKNTAGREHTESYTALIAGKSIPGLRAANINALAAELARHPLVDKEKIAAVGIEDLCIPLIYAAAFSNLVSSLVLVDSPASYADIALCRDYRIGFTVREGGGYWHPYEVDFNWGVAGALGVFDLPDLIGLIAPRKVMLAGMKNAKMEPADKKLIEKETAFPISVYGKLDAEANLRITDSEDSIEDMVEWALSVKR